METIKEKIIRIKKSRTKEWYINYLLDYCTITNQNKHTEAVLWEIGEVIYFIVNDDRKHISFKKSIYDYYKDNYSLGDGEISWMINDILKEKEIYSGYTVSYSSFPYNIRHYIFD